MVMALCRHGGAAWHTKLCSWQLAASTPEPTLQSILQKKHCYYQPKAPRQCVQRLLLTSVHTSKSFLRPSDILQYVGFTGVMCWSVDLFSVRNRAVLFRHIDSNGRAGW